jgi:phosphatidylglycerophosphatase C
MNIVVFDFDGTITSKDTMIRFIKFSKGKIKFYSGILIFSPLMLAYILKLYPNWKLKQKLFSYFYKGISIEKFNQWGKAFSIEIETLLRPKALEAIRMHQKQGDIVIIISASIENWIISWAEQVCVNRVLATKIEIDAEGKLTGRLLTKNCCRKEKVNRLLEVFPDRKDYTLIVYGDSAGDNELIEFSDCGWYNKFK